MTYLHLLIPLLPLAVPLRGLHLSSRFLLSSRLDNKIPFDVLPSSFTPFSIFENKEPSLTFRWLLSHGLVEGIDSLRFGHGCYPP